MTPFNTFPVTFPSISRDYFLASWIGSLFSSHTCAHRHRVSPPPPGVFGDEDDQDRRGFVLLPQGLSHHLPRQPLFCRLVPSLLTLLCSSFKTVGLLGLDLRILHILLVKLNQNLFLLMVPFLYMLMSCTHLYICTHTKYESTCEGKLVFALLSPAYFT